MAQKAERIMFLTLMIRREAAVFQNMLSHSTVSHMYMAALHRQALIAQDLQAMFSENSELVCHTVRQLKPDMADLFQEAKLNLEI